AAMRGKLASAWATARRARPPTTKVAGRQVPAIPRRSRTVPFRAQMRTGESIASCLRRAHDFGEGKADEQPEPADEEGADHVARVVQAKEDPAEANRRDHHGGPERELEARAGTRH